MILRLFFLHLTVLSVSSPGVSLHKFLPESISIQSKFEQEGTTQYSDLTDGLTHADVTNCHTGQGQDVGGEEEEQVVPAILNILLTGLRELNK